MWNIMWTLAKWFSELLIIIGIYIIAKNNGYNKGYRDGLERCKHISEKIVKNLTKEDNYGR